MLKYILLTIVGLSTFSTLTSEAVSFNCYGKLNNVERMICADATISQLDDKLTVLYKKTLILDKSNNTFIRTQKQWLATRNMCKDVFCIKSYYGARINELEQILYRGSIDESTDSEPTYGLVLACEYQKLENKEFERIQISSFDKYPNTSSYGESTNPFVNKKGTTQTQIYIIQEGGAAECIYPSGNRVKIKIGTGTARAYGMCGGDPEIFYSLWVNERKVESRVWFAGHCIEDRGFGGGLRYEIKNGSINKCNSVTKSDSNKNEKLQENCTNLPDVNQSKVDIVEYPPLGVEQSEPGTIEIVSGKDNLCELAKIQLTANKWPVFKAYAPNETAFSTKDIDYKIYIPKELEGATTQIFDFNNDGKLDLVISSYFSNNYMDSSPLLVEQGNSSTTLDLPKIPFSNDAWFLPCQLDRPDISLSTCPPFSQDNDESGFAVPTKNIKDTVYFRGRYTHLEPFRFNNRTYIFASSMAEATMNMFAIIEPLPKKKYRPVCLLQRVQENF
jgi:uncharacterized protein